MVEPQRCMKLAVALCESMVALMEDSCRPAHMVSGLPTTFDRPLLVHSHAVLMCTSVDLMCMACSSCIRGEVMTVLLDCVIPLTEQDFVKHVELCHAISRFAVLVTHAASPQVHTTSHDIAAIVAIAAPQCAEAVPDNLLSVLHSATTSSTTFTDCIATVST